MISAIVSLLNHSPVKSSIMILLNFADPYLEINKWITKLLHGIVLRKITNYKYCNTHQQLVYTCTYVHPSNYHSNYCTTVITHLPCIYAAEGVVSLLQQERQLFIREQYCHNPENYCRTRKAHHNCFETDIMISSSVSSVSSVSLSCTVLDWQMKQPSWDER